MFGYVVRSPLAGVQMAFSEVDRIRRRAGDVLDALGAGPRTSPCRTFDPAPGVRLRR